MSEDISKSDRIKNARIQYRPDGTLLGAAIFLPAGVVGRFIGNGSAELRYNLKPVPEGILVEIGAATDE